MYQEVIFMFLRFIAILFLILFLIKLINPKVFPFIKDAFDNVIHFIGYTFRLFFESSIYTVNLVFSRTIYVVGLDILIAFILNIIITTIAYPNINDFNTWFTLLKQNAIDVYVFSFFYFTYVIGLLTYMRRDQGTISKFISIFRNKTINNSLKKDGIKRNDKNEGTYEYDEKNDTYKYYD